MGMTYFETGWKTGDGIAIHARGWEPEGVSPDAVVCLVHGIGEHGGRYGHVAEAFCKKGMAFWAPDMRGHGLSGGVKGHLPSAETIVSDIAQYLAQARQRYPGIPMVLYGHSLGGIFVLYYGLKDSSGVIGVISTSPGLRNALEKQPLKVAAAKILGFLFPRLAISSGLDSKAISRNRQEVSTYLADPLVHDKMTLGFGKVMLGVNHYTLENSGKFSLPLLLLHGKKDSIAFPSGSEAVAASLGNRCTFVMWEEALHELHNEPEKEEVLQTMTGWVKSILKEQPE